MQLRENRNINSILLLKHGRTFLFDYIFCGCKIPQAIVFDYITNYLYSYMYKLYTIFINICCKIIFRINNKTTHDRNAENRL